MIRFIIMLSLILFCTSAHAGAGSFLFGYMLGGAGGTKEMPIARNDLAIPDICKIAKDFQDYKHCRMPSALEINWVAEDEKDCRNPDECMGIIEFLKREWAMLQLIKKEVEGHK